MARQADIDDGNRPGQIREDSTELRDLRPRNRLLEQENEVLRRAASCLRNRLLEHENEVLGRAASCLSQTNVSGKGSTRS